MRKVVKFNIKNFKHNLLILGIVLVFCMLSFTLYETFSEKTTSSIWDGTIAKSFTNGSGTTDDPYVISDGSELALLFSKLYSDESTEYYNKYYILNNNIDLKGNDFSYALKDKVFSGHIDGQGYKIFNFKISKYYMDDDIYNYTLFSKLYGATIENLNIADVTIVTEEKNIIVLNKEGFFKMGVG